MPLSVVILAAGQGKRMNSDLPKVLQPLAGRPLLAHVLDTAAALEASAVHVVYGHGGEQVRAVLEDTQVNWVLQAEQHGTGHAVMQAMPAIEDGDQVLVLYGDVPLVAASTLRDLVAAAGDGMSILTVRMVNPAGYGRVVRDATGRVVRVVEEKDANTKERAIDEVNTGLMVVSAARLREWLAQLRNDNAQGEYYLTDVVVAAVRAGLHVHALAAATETEVLGVNDKLQLAELESAYRRQRANELMQAGVTLVDPARIDIRGSLAVGRDVVIDANVVLAGAVRLGDRVHVGPNCYLEDCEIGDDTVIAPNCVVHRTVVGARCEIGPFARLRPLAHLHDDVHIGNFVEVKQSEIGAGSKANHLTYLGDTTVGARVNIGAGTITCNYDGANKWPTHIGTGAFIGSGAMLVAPVRIGDGATIGAGSVITRDAPEGKLTLERAKQVTVDGWKPPRRKPAE
jgi:bifunctional UDP-N-acetylglucosamine pyrophosphorylase / glucosamine-1-phosphate N-acetyltransferase